VERSNCKPLLATKETCQACRSWRVRTKSSNKSSPARQEIGSDSHDLLDSPLSVSRNLAARVVAERIRARYHSLKLARFMASVRDAWKAGGERWPQRQLRFRRFALAVNRACRESQYNAVLSQGIIYLRVRAGRRGCASVWPTPGRLGWESNEADMRAAYREAAARINFRRGVATHPMISAVAASGEDGEAGGRRRRAANPIQAMAIPAAIQPISP
jgi:hypothetical protein